MKGKMGIAIAAAVVVALVLAGWVGWGFKVQADKLAETEQTCVGSGSGYGSCMCFNREFSKRISVIYFMPGLDQVLHFPREAWGKWTDEAKAACPA